MIKYLTLRNKLDYSLPAMLATLLNNFWILICWAFGTYLLPVHSIIYIMVFMVCIDFITGMWKARKAKETITSKRMGDTIEKMILYMIGIVTSFVLQNHIGIESVNIMWVFGTLIITREYLSIIENIEILTGTKILKVISSYIAKLIPSTPAEDEPKKPEDNV